MEALTIKIWASDNGGYMFDIFDTDGDTEELESVEGGQFCGTLAQATAFAGKVASEYIERMQPDDEPTCCGSCEDDEEEENDDPQLPESVDIMEV